MKPKRTLFTKILFWFFLNLIILGVIFAGVINMRFKLAPNSPLSESSGNRMLFTARLIAGEISERPVSDWEEVLKRYSDIYKVDFLIFPGNRPVISSRDMRIPDKVIKKVNEHLDHFKPLFPPPLAGQRMEERPERPDRPPPRRPGLAPREQRPPRPGPGMGDQRTPPGDHQFKLHDISEADYRKPPGFSIRTKDPTRYWTGVGVGVFYRRLLFPRPAMIVAVSDSFTGNGLFFNPLPWIITITLIIVISVLFWTPLVRNITKPIKNVTKAAEQIARGKFDTRLDEKRKDEIGQLSKAINEMAARLKSYVGGQKKFLGDAAHELASPIARLQLSLSILEQNIDPENRDRLQDVAEEVEIMSNLVNELLSFTRAEIEPTKVQLENIDLAPLVESVIKRESNGETDIRVSVADNLHVYADPKLLSRALANLLRNAERYAGQAGPIEISASREKENVVIEVRDSGKGVPDEVIGRLFEPFFRPDSSRVRETGGVGLGLSIVKTCVETCQGAVSCRNLEPIGFAVTILLKAGR